MIKNENSFIRLQNWFIENTKGNVFIALSGGVDSAVVALAAKHALGERAIAITANYKTLARSEIEDAKQVAYELGIRHLIIEYNELEDTDFVRNDNQRCYYCRKGLGIELKKHSEFYKVTDIVDGTHIDDLTEYRPGISALREYGIKSPLVENNIGKEEIRKIAERFSICVANKPSNSCLASRIPHDTNITQERLSRIEKAELIVKKLLCVDQIRVRDHDEIARIEIGGNEFGKVFNIDKLRSTDVELRKLGFKYVTLDLSGYRSGNLTVLDKTVE